MSKAGKVWGETSVLLANPVVEVHKLWVHEHAHCSWHRHHHRRNAFVVLEGILIVEVRQKAYSLVDETILQAGDLMEVEAGLWHRFRTTATSALVLELYYPVPLQSVDIEREGVGGRDQSPA